MTLLFSDGAYNHASGTRDAFGALSDDLVAEGYPPMTSRSGDREPADQLKLWYERMTLTPGNRRVYDTKRWQGRTWYQIHPDAVGIPETSNHEKRRSNDLRAPYNADTAAARRAKVLARRHNITREGESFRELWHWTFWGPLGTIGTPAPAGGSTTAPPVPEEDEDMPKLIRWRNLHVFSVAQEAILYVDTTEQKGTLEALHGRPVQDVDQAGLEAALDERGIHWAAVDAVLRKVAPGTGGRYWSRLMAEGIAIRGNQDAQTKTLADVLATAKVLESAS